MASTKALLSIQEAAGYAMAAPSDEMDAPTSMMVTRSLDESLRLGHLSAAHQKVMPTQTLVFTKSVVEPARAALKGVMTAFWFPKAHA